MPRVVLVPPGRVIMLVKRRDQILFLAVTKMIPAKLVLEMRFLQSWSGKVPTKLINFVSLSLWASQEVMIQPQASLGIYVTAARVEAVVTEGVGTWQRT